MRSRYFSTYNDCNFLGGNVANYSPGVQPIVQKIKEVQAEQEAILKRVQEQVRPDGELATLYPDDAKLLDRGKAKLDVLFEVMEAYRE